jgi:ABC-type transport system involved in cytochrome bd biosynthesis fused ATPase/permease subunit
MQSPRLLFAFIRGIECFVVFYSDCYPLQYSMLVIRMVKFVFFIILLAWQSSLICFVCRLVWKRKIEG